MNKFVTNSRALIWTVASTVMTIVTLSGGTKTIGLWIFASALLLDVVGMALEKDE